MIAPDLRRQNGWNVSSLIYFVFSVHLLEMSRLMTLFAHKRLSKFSIYTITVQLLLMRQILQWNNDERAIFSSMYVSSVLYFFGSVLCLLTIVRWVVAFQVPFIHYHSCNQHKKMSQTRTSLAMHTCVCVWTCCLICNLNPWNKRATNQNKAPILWYSIFIRLSDRNNPPAYPSLSHACDGAPPSWSKTTLYWSKNTSLRLLEK